jgi:adenylate kinase family enzyme
MRPLERVHIFGAAGCGSSTLGWALARRLECQHFDTDDFYWLPTTPPFRSRRATPERLRLLTGSMAPSRRWVLSGSVAGWGDALIPQFDLVVFLYVPTEIRLARLARRERARFGDALDPGGPMEEQHQAFLRWAAGYDPGVSGSRTLRADATWLGYLPCPVLSLMGVAPTVDQIAAVLSFWQDSVDQPKSPTLPGTSEVISAVMGKAVRSGAGK